MFTNKALKMISAFLLLTTLTSSAASAATLLELAESEASRLALHQAQPVARERNPYLWPGLAVIGGGIALAILGFTDETGAEVGIGDPFGSNPGVSVEVKKNTALGFTGLGVAGAGVVMLMVGERKRQAGPRAFVLAGRGFAVQRTVRF